MRLTIRDEEMRTVVIHETIGKMVLTTGRDG
jgi:hypothetical protein